MQQFSHITKIFLVSLASVMGLLVVLLFIPSNPPMLRIDYLDIGQGDSILITTPNKFQILVDGGPDSLVLERLRDVMPIGDRSIDWLIMSHSDSDHLTGLVDVIENYQVSRVIMQDYENHTNVYTGWMEILRKEEISVSRMSDDQQMVIDKEISLHFFQQYNEKLDVNNASLVFQLKFRDVSFFFSGDVEKEAEEYLVEAYSNELSSTVLKIGHHGSKTSSTVEFLEMIDPKLAIIQVGKDNKFNHPNLRTLYRLDLRGIKYWRTDEDGTISLISDGWGIWRQKARFSVFPQLFGKSKEKVYNVADNN